MSTTCKLAKVSKPFHGVAGLMSRGQRWKEPFIREESDSLHRTVGQRSEADYNDQYHICSCSVLLLSLRSRGATMDTWQSSTLWSLTPWLRNHQPSDAAPSAQSWGGSSVQQEGGRNGCSQRNIYTSFEHSWVLMEPCWYPPNPGSQVIPSGSCVPTFSRSPCGSGQRGGRC